MPQRNGKRKSVAVTAGRRVTNAAACKNDAIGFVNGVTSRNREYVVVFFDLFNVVANEFYARFFRSANERAYNVARLYPTRETRDCRVRLLTFVPFSSRYAIVLSGGNE